MSKCKFYNQSWAEDCEVQWNGVPRKHFLRWEMKIQILLLIFFPLHFFAFVDVFCIVSIKIKSCAQKRRLFREVVTKSYKNVFCENQKRKVLYQFTPLLQELWGPPGINFMNVLRAQFKHKIFAPKNFGFKFFWYKNVGAKCAHKMLMKLTTVVPNKT